MKKRLLSLLLAALMILSLLPTAAFAAARDEEPVPMAAPAAEEDALSTPAAAEEVPAVAVEDDLPVVLAAATNIAQDRPASASFELNSGGTLYPASNLVDNNTNTRWCGHWDKTATETIVIDLGSSATVQTFVFHWAQSTWATQLIIKTAAADSGWDSATTVFSQTYSSNPATDSVQTVTPTSTSLQRYVRFELVGNGTTGSHDSLAISELEIYGELVGSAPSTNLARLEGVTAEDDHHEEGTRDNGEAYNLNGAQAIDGVKTGDEHLNSGHWSTNQGVDVQRTLIVDLHRNCDINEIKLFWKNASVYTYTLSTSADKQTWNTVYTQNTRVSDGAAGESVPVSSHNTGVRYVRLQATANRGDTAGATTYWGNVNLWEIEVYGTAGDLIPDSSPTNLARLSGVTARASGNETATFPPEKAIDGNTSTNNSRWSSSNNTDPAWIIVDLHRMSTVTGIDLYWQRDNVVSYKLEVSSNKKDWTLVHSTSTRITQLHETFHENTYENVRYVRVYSDNHDDEGASTYNNISLWEIEVYGTATGPLIPSVSSVLDSIMRETSNQPLEVNADKTRVVLKDAAAALVPAGLSVKFAANLEQVVGEGGIIYTPVADREVAIDLSVVDNSDPDEVASTPADNPIYLTIPRKPAETETETDWLAGNAKPAVIPEIMEWFSHGENEKYYNKSYTISKGSSVRILHRYAFDGVAKALQADLKDLLGVEAELVTLTGSFSTLQGEDLKAGDIILFDQKAGDADPRKRVQGYDNETYGMEIFGDKIYIYATHATGAYWGTRTLLQGLKLNEEDGEDGKTWSFPNGTLRDYPEFKVRGFMLDVGRKPESLNTLYTIAKNMAWYKLNDLHLHLNDNLIHMEDYCTQSDRSDYQSAYEAYSAFRMESSIQEEPGAKPLTAKDYAYTKAEFKQFVKDSAALGVNIIPEFDVPAHAKAITDSFPSLRLNKTGTFWGTTRPWIDHLDLSNKMDESLAKVQEIFSEYITGSDPVFAGNVVHFGADEYYDDYAQYAPFAKGMVDYIQSQGKTVRMWGSFSVMGDSAHLFTKDVAQNIQMNIWDTSWANPTAMYDLGFNLININNNPFYMVPNGGGGRGAYGDYLVLDTLYQQPPNKIGDAWFPASSSQILGSSVGMWQDNIDTKASGLDEVDMFTRFFEAIPIASVRMWGVASTGPARNLTALQADIAKLGVAPGTDPYYYQADEADRVTYDFTDANPDDLTLTGAEINESRSLLVLKGGASYAETGLNRLGWGSQLSFRALKLTGGDEQVIFEADHAYGDYAIKALPVAGDDSKWKLGFSRELYDYEFNVELPVGEWVTLTLTNEQQSTKLTYDGTEYSAVGKFVSKPDSNTQFKGKTGITNSSFELPVARIGSKENAFNGYIAAVTIGEPIEVPPSPLTETKYDIPTTKYTVTAGSEEATAHNNNTEGPLSYATDDNVNTYWHSNYNEDLTSQSGKRWIQIELDVATPVSLLRYQPRPTIANGIVTEYCVKVSDTGTDWDTATVVAEGTWAKDSTAKMAVFDSAVTAKYIRLYGVETQGADRDTPNKFMSCAEIRVCRPIDLNTDIHATATPGEVTWGETAATATFTVTSENDHVLTEGTDYEVTCSNNTTVGATATATIKGIGGYTGTLTATFTVPAKPVIVDLSAATVTFDQPAYPLENGKAEPTPTVKIGDTAYLRGLDYEVTYANNTAVGTATVTITGIAPCTGTKTATFPVIEKKNLSDAAKTKVTLSQTSFLYDGEPVKPEPTVTYEGETLTKGTHYTLSYSRNNAVGTATVTVTGRAPYCEGSASVNFTILDPAKGNDLGDMSKTTVTFAKQSYELVNGKAEPEPSVRYDGKRLVKGRDYTLSYLNNTSGGTGVVVVTGAGEYYGSYPASFTIIGGGAGAGDTPGSDPGTGSGGGSSGGGSSAGIPSPVVVSTEITKGDGVTTTVKTDSTGAMTAQSTYDDGTKVIADIPVTGPITAVVTVPTRVDTVTVTIPTRGEPTPGQVAVILHPDGTEEIVKTSLPTENGVELTLDASATVQVVDNTKRFTDVPANNWAKNAIDFVTSREIFNGTGNNTFTPTGDMSRAMVCTVLANLAGADTKGGATWYEKSVNWAKQSGISDGSTPNATVTREQLAAMLYRYAGSPTVSDEVPRRFRDRDTISDWAEIAVTWAVQNDLIHGRGSDEGLDLAPQATATRAEVAAVLQRYVALLK